MKQRDWQDTTEDHISDAEVYLALAESDPGGVIPTEKHCLASIACSLLAIAKSLDSLEDSGTRHDANRKAFQDNV